jgi:hypothetical protein
MLGARLKSSSNILDKFGWDDTEAENFLKIHCISNNIEEACVFLRILEGILKQMLQNSFKHLSKLKPFMALSHRKLFLHEFAGNKSVC